ncbi:hypothetical protein OIE13_05955 [Streptosporangium sp. NBC_01810]|uniref:hypothetical protein n=1 Tax=Streptosporangium sp. NBC_01810 TaxID=2975951 RepID=UPI002DDBD023|nr:hypothetical protein [Streptosporangium sp. NBC_01810]WSA27417.1 hypothetical protein OIE13_05955 [Streptosporangium sp. NBC_01810]
MGDVDVSALIASLQGLQHRASPAAQAAVDGMAEAAETAMRAALSRGPAPSAPGSPPARRSGALRRSVEARPAFQTGPARWEARTYSGIAYARIHEVGGWTGRNHASYLPPRPYVAPTVISMRGVLERIAADTFAREVGL